MSDRESKKIITGQGGVFNDLAIRIKLVLRLLADRRISPFLKLLPIGSLAYFVIPDLVLGPVDDMVVIWLGAFLFVELCPPEIVQEHMMILKQLSGKPGSIEDQSEGEVIDGEFWEKKE